jgi:prepilin-type processing-associated H-X9-DG protein
VFVTSRDNTISFADITDGASYTAMISEWVLGPFQLKISDPLGSVYSTPAAMILPSEFDAFIAECQGVDVTAATDALRYKGHNWIHGSDGKTVYNHNEMINGHSCLNGSFVREGSWTCASRHLTGAHVLLADGHVRFVRSSLSLPIWRALATRAGNEIVGDMGF